MENILITMTDDGNLSCEDANGGYIEELRARQLVFTVNSLFQSDIISYFTISFEPKGFGKKITCERTSGLVVHLLRTILSLRKLCQSGISLP